MRGMSHLAYPAPFLPLRMAHDTHQYKTDRKEHSQSDCPKNRVDFFWGRVRQGCEKTTLPFVSLPPEGSQFERLQSKGQDIVNRKELLVYAWSGLGFRHTEDRKGIPCSSLIRVGGKDLGLLNLYLPTNVYKLPKNSLKSTWENELKQKTRNPNIWETKFKEQMSYKNNAPNNKRVNCRPSSLNWDSSNKKAVSSINGIWTPIPN